MKPNKQLNVPLHDRTLLCVQRSSEQANTDFSISIGIPFILPRKLNTPKVTIRQRQYSHWISFASPHNNHGKHLPIRSQSVKNRKTRVSQGKLTQRSPTFCRNRAASAQKLLFSLDSGLSNCQGDSYSTQIHLHGGVGTACSLDYWLLLFWCRSLN